MAHVVRWAAAVGVAVAAAAGCAPVGDGAPGPGVAPAGAGPSLVLITVDTLRADHLPAYGYFRATSPAIDELIREGVLFENGIAPMATTLPSHASLLTSTYPVRHGVLSNLRFFKQAAMTTEDIRSVAQMLAERGYRTAGFTSSSPLCAESGIGTGFGTFEGPPADVAETPRVDVVAGSTVDRARDWLEDAGHPFFLWVHLFDPHSPYAPPEPYGRSYAPSARLHERLEQRHVPRELLGKATGVATLYDGEIQYVDAEVGRLLGALRARGLYDGAIVVFTADHGEGLWQHGVLEHGVIWNEQLRVPLVMRFPGGTLPPGAERRMTKLASLIDVMPTLAAAAGLPLDTAQFDGIDLFSASRDTALAQREIRARVWPAENFALVGLDWKYTYFADADPLLFDLAADPHETRNVIADHPHVAARMRDELLQLVAAHKARSPLGVTVDIPDDVRRRIEALGYVE
jgi:arylsulfatase A-like enzyme